MQLLDARRHPNETFYFDEPTHELYIDKNVLARHGQVPVVEYLNDNSVIGTYLTEDSVLATQDLQIRHDLNPGERLLEVSTRDGDSREFSVHGRWQAEASGSPTGHYRVQPSDMLIVRDRHGHDDDPAIVDAGKTLPARADGWSWRPLGLITTASKPEGRLVTWEGLGADARWLVEVSVANYLVSSEVDLATVRHEVGSGRSMRGSIGCNVLASTYLRWFFSEFSGVDYEPHTEPRDRVWRDPAQAKA